MANDNDKQSESAQEENPAIRLLEDARSILSSGGKRGKPGALAYDGDGNVVDPRSDKATNFTLGGALQKAIANRGGDSTGIDTVHVLLGIGNLTDASIAGLDALDDKEIGKRFDKALAQARGEKWTDPDEGKDEETEEEETRRVRDSDTSDKIDGSTNPAGNVKSDL